MESTKTQYSFALLRLALGFIFLWAFLDKTFGLGFATTPDSSWLNGGSPTTGFLQNAVQGPFAGFYQSLAGNGLVDWLFMLGLLGLGLSLMLGIYMKIAGWTGALLMLLMWTSLLFPENNPLLDEHIIYLLILLILPQVKAGQTLGFGKAWARTPWVKKYSFLE